MLLRAVKAYVMHRFCSNLCMKPDHPHSLLPSKCLSIIIILGVILAYCFSVQSTKGQPVQVQALFRVAGLGINEHWQIVGATQLSNVGERIANNRQALHLSLN